MTLIIGFFLIVILILLFCLYAYRTAFYSPKRNRTDDIPLKGHQYEALAEHIRRIGGIMKKIPFETVTIRSFDGKILYGRYYHINDEAPLEILFHGYRSHAFRDCSGGHALARKMGYNTLVVDQRAHGMSEGTTICFGIKERHDCISWIHYANRRFGADKPILLSGLSMGAATVLMAADLELPENIVCIIADSPYSAPGAIIEKVCADLHYPVSLCRPFIHLSALIFGGFCLNGCTAKESVSKATVPILLIHGEADHFVPCAMSHEIADCCASPVTVHTFPEAGHGLSYMIDPLRYERAVYDFLCTIPRLDGTICESFVNQLSE